jgi:hypothetical protein
MPPSPPCDAREHGYEFIESADKLFVSQPVYPWFMLAVYTKSIAHCMWASDFERNTGKEEDVEDRKKKETKKERLVEV